MSPPSPEWSTRRHTQRTYRKRARPIAQQSPESDRSSSLSPLPSSYDEQTIEGPLYSTSGPGTASGSSSKLPIVQATSVSSSTVKADVVNKEDVGRLRKSGLKRTRSSALENAATSSSNSLTMNQVATCSKRVRMPPQELELAPLRQSSQAENDYGAVDNDAPLFTPPESVEQAEARARHAARTPRTPPRDITDLLLRKPSPSPMGRHVHNPHKALGRSPKRGRKQMMSRTESFGDHAQHESDDAWGLVDFGKDKLDLGTLSAPHTPPRSPPRVKQTVSYVSSPSRLLQRGANSMPSLPASPSNRALHHTISTGAATTEITDPSSRVVGGSHLGSLASLNQPSRAGVRTYGRSRLDVGSSLVVESTAASTSVSNNAPDESVGNSSEHILSSPQNWLQQLGSRPVPRHEESYSELNRRFGVDVDDDDDDLNQESQGVRLRNIFYPCPNSE